MKRFLTLVGAVAVALTFGTGQAQSQVITTAPFEITAGGFKYTISMNQGSYFEFTGGVTDAIGNVTTLPNLPGGLFFTGVDAAARALEAATSFAANYFPSTNAGVPTEPVGGFSAQAGHAYAFAYALSATNPTLVSAHVAAFEQGTVGTAGGGSTGVYQGLAIDTSNAILTIGNPNFSNQANYVVNWADEISRQRLVPEIDGPVLAQVGFVLAGLYFVMLGRRRRGDEAEMSQAT